MKLPKRDNKNGDLHNETVVAQGVASVWQKFFLVV